MCNKDCILSVSVFSGCDSPKTNCNKESLKCLQTFKHFFFFLLIFRSVALPAAFSTLPGCGASNHFNCSNQETYPVQFILITALDSNKQQLLTYKQDASRSSQMSSSMKETSQKCFIQDAVERRRAIGHHFPVTQQAA